ncbi:protein DMP3 [Quercus suber]|uniref:protein DMP3 n=1 Tax=Quercus suber TaxID=58331 RepID=UPI0032DE8A01
MSTPTIRSRPTVPTKEPSIKDVTAATPNVDQDALNPPLQRQPSMQQRATQSLTSTVANLANLLPTGTLLAFQLLMPVFTQNGSCDSATRAMTLVLLALLALSCFLASFTDSVKASDGQVYYGLATSKGLWLFDCPDLTFKAAAAADANKKREFRDWLHAVLSVLVFGAVALRDKNAVQCFYPTPGKETQEVLNIVPMGIGIICSLRHWTGSSWICIQKVVNWNASDDKGTFAVTFSKTTRCLSYVQGSCSSTLSKSHSSSKLKNRMLSPISLI